MGDDTLPPSETRAGVEQIAGEEYEYPYRVTDWNGKPVRKNLDTVPPFLNQEQIDTLAAHLADANLSSAVLFRVLRDLPDSEWGRHCTGSVKPHCQKCGEVITGPGAVRFEYFYHENCLPDGGDADD